MLKCMHGSFKRVAVVAKKLSIWSYLNNRGGNLRRDRGREEGRETKEGSEEGK